MSKYKQALAKQFAMKAMAMGGNVMADEDDENEDSPLSLQMKGDYEPEYVGGSEELARSLMQQMAEGGMVLAQHSPDVEPGDPETVPTRTPESLDMPGLTEEAKKAIDDKKKRRRYPLRG